MTIYHFLISDSKMSWFHGKICREEAERRLKYQGDYLVRSHGNGQFVLSCMDSGHVRHLLLVDPHGQVGYLVKISVIRNPPNCAFWGVPWKIIHCTFYTAIWYLMLKSIVQNRLGFKMMI